VSTVAQPSSVFWIIVLYPEYGTSGLVGKVPGDLCGGGEGADRAMDRVESGNLIVGKLDLRFPVLLEPLGLVHFGGLADESGHAVENVLGNSV
jgi:hypothetical protein